MKRRLMCAFLLLLPFVVMAASPRQSNQPARKSSPQAATSSQANAGERVFAANCSRCHQAPMSLAPRITGTVIMHMRTRARLSREDEKLLLKYLAP